VRFVKKEKKIFQAQNVYNQVLTTLAREEAKRLRDLATELEKARDRIVTEERERLKTQAERIREIKKNKAEQEEAQKQLERFQESCNKLQVEDKHLTQEIAYKSEDLVKFERKAQEADRELSRIITQCEEIRHKLPTSRDALAARTAALEAMRTELAKHEKPQLRQKIRECELEVSRCDLEANNLKGKLETIRAAAGKARSGRG
jgi:chromosome segregation ATPase